MGIGALDADSEGIGGFSIVGSKDSAKTDWRWFVMIEVPTSS